MDSGVAAMKTQTAAACSPDNDGLVFPPNQQAGSPRADNSLDEAKAETVQPAPASLSIRQAPVAEPSIASEEAEPQRTMKKIPAALRALADFNGKGATEKAPMSSFRRIRQPRRLLDAAPFPGPADKTAVNKPKHARSTKESSKKRRHIIKKPGAGRPAVAAVPSSRPVPSVPPPQPVVRNLALAGVTVPDLSKGNVKRLPAALRLLADFNGKGGTEDVPLSAVRARRPPRHLTVEEEDIQELPAPKKKRRRRQPVVEVPVRPVTPPPSQEELAAVPGPKVWVLLHPSGHRRVRALLGNRYKYKQHVPTPAWLRERNIEFTIRVQMPNELIVTLCDSHYVVSGHSRGFSWSHVYPCTMTRLANAEKYSGSRQGDGKPNTFSPLYNRCDTVIRALHESLDRDASPWHVDPETTARHVRNTRSDQAYNAQRLAEGWSAKEIGPLLLPTSEQLADPEWYTSMVKQHSSKGSLHIRLPEDWIGEGRNFEYCLSALTSFYFQVIMAVVSIGHRRQMSSNWKPHPPMLSLRMTSYGFG